MRDALDATTIAGIETNLEYLRQIVATPEFAQGGVITKFLNTLPYHARTVEVLEGGTLTTVQDFPGRLGYWNVGVPPSGPLDSLAFRRGNQLLGNPEGAPGLECTVPGRRCGFTWTRLSLSQAPTSCAGWMGSR